MALVTKPIRGLDEELYRKAKAQAAREGKNIGAWINEAIAHYLPINNAGKKRKK